MDSLKAGAIRRVVVTLAIAAIVLALALVAFGPMSPSGGPADTNSISHQDGDVPPTCRPAGKYPGDPHPNEAACKHKPDKHN